MAREREDVSKDNLRTYLKQNRLRQALTDEEAASVVRGGDPSRQAA
jgi:hypothetical protein